MAGGRPKGAKDEQPWVAALRLALSEEDTINGKKIRRLRRVADACVTSAIEGDVSAIKEIGDRLDGKVPQAQVLQGDKENPFKAIVEHTFKSAI